jgi:hypothetical protein
MNEDQGKSLQQSLYTEDRIEVPLFFWQNAWHFRVSCPAYAVAADFHRLAGAIEARL